MTPRADLSPTESLLVASHAFWLIFGEGSVSARPVLFTVEFRRKMAQLSQDQRQEWLASLARRIAPGGGARSVELDGLLAQELHEVARGCRLRLIESVERQLGPFDERQLRALLEVPRERFVRAADIAHSADDAPLPLDDNGLATISAPHAYLLSFRLLRLAPGDSFVELGTGSGYGAALAAFIVGPRGRVVTFEIDRVLADWAHRLLADDPSMKSGDSASVTVVERDAMTSFWHWGRATKVAVTFAVESLSPDWLRALPDGGMLVAPVGPPDRDQRLVLAIKRQGRVVESDHGAVRYVRNRSAR